MSKLNPILRRFLVSRDEAVILMVYHVREARRMISNATECAKHPHWENSDLRRRKFLRWAKESGQEAKRWATKLDLPLGRPAKPRAVLPRQEVAA